MWKGVIYLVLIPVSVALVPEIPLLCTFINIRIYRII